MDNYHLSGIYVYPVKSLGGVELENAQVEERGLKFDRRWMVVDENNIFLSQRRLPAMALIRTGISGNKIKLTHKSKTVPPLYLTADEYSGQQTSVKIFEKEVPAHFVSSVADEWFSEALGVKCRLVYMSATDIRHVNPKYAKKNETVSFADGFPFLIIGQPSMDLLNSKLQEKLSIMRFRPNFVFEGGNPHDEDKWLRIKIGEITFNVVKPCARCVITTVNQETAEKGKEPLRTLSKYRRASGKIFFGQNMIAGNTGQVKLNDEIKVLKIKTNEI